MADASYHRAWYATHKEAKARHKRKYMISEKGFAYLEKMRQKYINDEEYRNKCLERSREQIRKRKEKQT